MRQIIEVSCRIILRNLRCIVVVRIFQLDLSVRRRAYRDIMRQHTGCMRIAMEIAIIIQPVCTFPTGCIHINSPTTGWYLITRESDGAGNLILR